MEVRLWGTRSSISRIVGNLDLVGAKAGWALTGAACGTVLIRMKRKRRRAVSRERDYRKDSRASGSRTWRR